MYIYICLYACVCDTHNHPIIDYHGALGVPMNLFSISNGEGEGRLMGSVIQLVTSESTITCAVATC